MSTSALSGRKILLIVGGGIATAAKQVIFDMQKVAVGGCGGPHCAATATLGNGKG